MALLLALSMGCAHTARPVGEYSTHVTTFGRHHAALPAGCHIDWIDSAAAHSRDYEEVAVVSVFGDTWQQREMSNALLALSLHAHLAACPLGSTVASLSKDDDGRPTVILWHVPDASAPAVDSSHFSPPPQQPSYFQSDARVAGVSFSSERLNLEATVPVGFEVVQKPAIYEVRIHQANTQGLLFLAVDGTERSESRFLSTFIPNSLKEMPPGSRIEERGESPRKLALGEATQRSWEFFGPLHGYIRVSSVPICDDKAAFVFIERWEEPDANLPLEEWVKSFHFARAGAVPVCSSL